MRGHTVPSGGTLGRFVRDAPPPTADPEAGVMLRGR
jgi:hypothetical protein